HRPPPAPPPPPSSPPLHDALPIWMTRTPAYLSAVTACSRLLPTPQLRPATITSPGWALAAKVGSRSSSACAAISAGSRRVYVYLPGKITSVLTPSPYTQTRCCVVMFVSAPRCVFKSYVQLRALHAITCDHMRWPPPTLINCPVTQRA